MVVWLLLMLLLMRPRQGTTAAREPLVGQEVKAAQNGEPGSSDGRCNQPPRASACCCCCCCCCCCSRLRPCLSCSPRRTVRVAYPPPCPAINPPDRAIRTLKIQEIRESFTCAPRDLRRISLEGLAEGMHAQHRDGHATSLFSCGVTSPKTYTRTVALATTAGALVRPSTGQTSQVRLGQTSLWSDWAGTGSDRHPAAITSQALDDEGTLRYCTVP